MSTALSCAPGSPGELAPASQREQLLAAAWLAGHRSRATRAASVQDLAGWLDWLAQHDLGVRTLHVQLFTRAQLDASAAPASSSSTANPPGDHLKQLPTPPSVLGPGTAVGASGLAAVSLGLSR